MNKNTVNTNAWFTLFILFGIIIIAVIIGICTNNRCAWLFYGMFNTMMYIHLTLARICNITIGRDYDTPDDTAWKIIFTTLGCIGLSIGILN